jgi:hypothetical protein
MLKLACRLAILCFTLGATSAFAASGSALGVDPDADAERGNEKITLTVGADLFIGDRVVTGPQGQVQILFSDKTELVVGPNSAMVLEDYLLRENGSAGKLAINALSGTFRFATGGAPKDRYIVETPTGTIGVRGTIYELFVTPQFFAAMVRDGTIIACPLGVPQGDPSCEIADDGCEVVQVEIDDALLLGNSQDITDERRTELKNWFQYVVDQSSLLRQFKVNDDDKCLRRASSGGGAPSLMDSVGNDDGYGYDYYNTY